MNQAEKELLLQEVEHQVGMVRTFHADETGAEDLVELYEGYRKEGASITEVKLFLEDLKRFLGKN